MDIRQLYKLRFKDEEVSFKFPAGFEPAKSVPNGEAGIMCYTCAKWNPDTKLCQGQYYINWNGNGKIPNDNPNEYACVWWVDKRIK